MKKLLNLIHFSLLIPICASLAFGCTSTKNLSDAGHNNSIKKVDYSVTYLIHGDTDYLYHDSLGNALQADKEVLAEAKHIGKDAVNGEVLIFHQRPEKKILWLFPKKDRRFFYYRNGKLIDKINYSPSKLSDSEIFSAESRLYQQYASLSDSLRNNILLYFGHEIPYKNGQNYFRSSPDLKMNTDRFSNGVGSLIAGTGDTFDLLVLSTCNNGSPDMVHALSPHTRFLLASPQNLHLSHIDTYGLSVLEKKPRTGSKKVGVKLADESYKRLSNTVETVVSLSLYNMQKISSYIQKADSAYRSFLKNDFISDPGIENVDCKSLPLFDEEINFSKGVLKWYRPPLFGRKADKENHSGWGCKDLKN